MSKVFLILVLVVLLGLGVFMYLKSSPTIKTGIVGAKNYNYPNPSFEAQNRQVDCYKNYIYKGSNKRVLCLNLFQTSVEDISLRLKSSTYDRIVLYGEKAFYDGPTVASGIPDFPQRLYLYARFADQIMIPKMMPYFGLKNLNYVSPDFMPLYSAFYISFYDTKTTIEKCNADSGCASEGFIINMNTQYLSEKYQGVNPTGSFHRYATDTELYYNIKWPRDCYISSTMLHETAHQLFNARTISFAQRMYATEGEYFAPPEWFDEQQAGFWGVWGVELVCGPGVYTDFSGKWEGKKDDSLRLVKFQTQYPPDALSHDFPKDDSCKLAMVNEFYRFLDKGPLEIQMPKFYEASLPKVKDDSLYDDKKFAAFLWQLSGNDPKEKDFLNSKGCGI